MDDWVFRLLLVVILWLCGLVTGLALRGGQQHEAEARGYMKARRHYRQGPPHPSEADPAKPWTW